jgi:hypothetical protein
MSHTTTIELEIKSEKALAQACEDLGVPYKANTTEKLYDGTVAEGFSFKPKGWLYPVVATKDGRLLFDNYEGAWGKIEELNKIKQRYAVNSQIEVAKSRGYRVKEQVIGGKIKLTIER